MKKYLFLIPLFFVSNIAFADSLITTLNNNVITNHSNEILYVQIVNDVPDIVYLNPNQSVDVTSYLTTTYTHISVYNPSTTILYTDYYYNGSNFTVYTNELCSNYDICYVIPSLGGINLNSITETKDTVKNKAYEYLLFAGDIILWGLLISFSLAIIAIIYRRISRVR